MKISKEVWNAIRAASIMAADDFKSQCELINRNVYEARGKLGDDGRGAVYVYYSSKGKALYVGETGRYIKARKHDQTSPHKTTEWWDKWKGMRFAQMSDETDRLILEMLLALGLQPKYNKKPRPKAVSKLFET
jgi:hypothetical protein